MKYCGLNKNTYSRDLAARKKNEPPAITMNLEKGLLRNSTRALEVFGDNFQHDCCYFKLFSFYSNIEIVTEKLMLKKISGDSSPRSTMSSLEPGSATT